MNTDLEKRPTNSSSQEDNDKAKARTGGKGEDQQSSKNQATSRSTSGRTGVEGPP